jgi:hypothetical protein
MEANLKLNNEIFWDQSRISDKIINYEQLLTKFDNDKNSARQLRETMTEYLDDAEAEYIRLKQIISFHQIELK